MLYIMLFMRNQENHWRELSKGNTLYN